MHYDTLWVALKEMAVSQPSIVLMHNLYCGEETTARTELFPIGKGIRQVCILFPYMVNPYTEHTWKTVLDSEERGIKKKLVEKVSTNADDAILLAESRNNFKCLPMKSEEEKYQSMTTFEHENQNHEHRRNTHL